MLAKSEYLEVLKDFKIHTENSKLVWDRPNQTTYRLHNPINQGLNIVLQKYEDVRSKKDSFLFTVSNKESKEHLVVIDSAEDKDFYEVLFNLFSSISFNLEKTNIKLLKNIISELTTAS